MKTTSTTLAALAALVMAAGCGIDTRPEEGQEADAVTVAARWQWTATCAVAGSPDPAFRVVCAPEGDADAAAAAAVDACAKLTGATCSDCRVVELRGTPCCWEMP